MNGAPLPQDTELVQVWMEDNYASPVSEGRMAGLPFSFKVDGVPAGDCPFDVSGGPVSETEGRMVREVALTHESSGLRVRCVMTAFEDYPAVEWVLHLRNDGDEPPPIVSEIQALDCGFPCAPEEPCILRHARGSDCKIDDFQPLEDALGPSAEMTLAPAAGRSSDGTLPFFNVMMGKRGFIGAIGWTGGWTARFSRGEDGLRVTAGMSRTHLRLLPGEEIRSPRILLLGWTGEALHGHNMLRRLILRHYSPRPNGEPVHVPMCDAVWGERRADDQIAKAKWWIDNRIPLDKFWIDAGWHGDAEFLEGSTVFNSGWGAQVGNWWPNKTTYPEGLRPVGEALEQMGLGFVLWLEPERVFEGTVFSRDHREWLLGPIGGNWLYNLGNPEARKALADLISALITEGKITCYRQDFNMAATPFWEAADAPDRVGISEIRHIEGLYAFWDELLARHPDLLIDNCSSGGRRLDIETASRSVPLWRSDFQCYPDFDPIGIQGQTHGLGLWLPLSAGCCDRNDTYAFRSALGPGIVVSTNIYQEVPAEGPAVDWLREMMTQQRALGPYFHGDFYPLTAFSLSTDVWAVWQFDRPDLGEGMVLALRRQDSPYTAFEAILQGLNTAASYELEWLDGGRVEKATGADLAGKGLSLDIESRPGSAVVVYRKRP